MSQKRKNVFLYLLLVAMVVQIINIGEVLAKEEDEILESSEEVYEEENSDVEERGDLLHNEIETAKEDLPEKPSEVVGEEGEIEESEAGMDEETDVDMEIQLCEGNKILCRDDIEVKGRSLALDDRDESLEEVEENDKSKNHNKADQETDRQVKDVLPKTGIEENTLWLGSLSLLGGFYLKKKARRM